MARHGINKAIESQYKIFEIKRLLHDLEYTQNRTCIFISHKKEDIDKAREVADYIMECGVDIYFDENDEVLSNPGTSKDPIEVTNAINKALNRSTHMICVISNKTKESWWVPYEIGYVSSKSSFTTRKIGILLINDINQLPDYLFLSTKIETVIDLDNFVKNASNTETLLIEEVKTYNEIINHKMKNILK